MLNEKDIIARIERDAQGLILSEGVRFEVEKQPRCPVSVKPDLFLKLSTKNKSIHLLAEVVARPSRAVFMNRIDRIKISADLCDALPIIIAPYLSPDERSICRDHQVLFLDLSGNQWISFEGFLIEREGFKNKFPEERGGRNPFSDKASLIIRELISNYGMERGVRELAVLLNLSPGYVSKIVLELEKRSYIQKLKNGLRLINPEELITDWVSHYSIRNNRLHKYFLSVPGVDEVLNKVRKINPSRSEYALTGQAGASLVYKHASYDTVHIYVNDKNAQSLFVDSLQMNMVERGENVILMDPKYKKSVFYGSRNISGLNIVSDLQLYLDLYHYQKRGREQAEKIFEEKLAPIFK